jgi:hypothetical protein
VAGVVRFCNFAPLFVHTFCQKQVPLPHLCTINSNLQMSYTLPDTSVAETVQVYESFKARFRDIQTTDWPKIVASWWKVVFSSSFVCVCVSPETNIFQKHSRKYPGLAYAVQAQMVTLSDVDEAFLASRAMNVVCKSIAKPEIVQIPSALRNELVDFLAVSTAV